MGFKSYVKINSYGLNKDHSLTQYILNGFINSNKKEREKIFEVVKERKKGSVYKFNYNRENYYLKFYSPKKLKNKIKNLLRKPNGIRVYKKAEKLKKYNIKSLSPILAIELKKNYLLSDSIFVSKELTGENLISFIRKNKLSRDECRKITKLMAELWADLINNNFLHLDPNLNNFIISENKTGFEISLIDVDPITKYIKMPLVLKLHATARLYAYVLKHKNFSLGLEARENFSEVFVNNFQGKNLESDYFIQKMNKITLKRFVKENRTKLLNNDPMLSKLYKK